MADAPSSHNPPAKPADVSLDTGIDLSTNLYAAKFHQLVLDMREAVAVEFPERAGRIYIMDPTQPINEEIERASAALVIPNLRALVNKEDEGLLTRNGQRNTWGRTLSFPMNKSEGANGFETQPSVETAIVFPSYPKTFDVMNSDIFRITINALPHEVAHALQSTDPDYAKTLPYVNGKLSDKDMQKREETFAETFAADVNRRNGLATDRDEDILLAEHDADSNMRYAFYDEYHALRKRYPAEGFPSYHGYHGLRESYDRAMKVQDLNLLPSTYEEEFSALEVAKFKMFGDMYMRSLQSPFDIEAVKGKIDAEIPYIGLQTAGNDYLAKPDHPYVREKGDVLKSIAQIWLIDEPGPEDGITDPQIHDFLAQALNGYADAKRKEGAATPLTPEIIELLASHPEISSWADDLVAGVPLQTALADGLRDIKAQEGHGLPDSTKPAAPSIPQPSLK